ncbi:glycosyltransferase family 39 protein, partial [Patescibacteria group bacterium]|nr:glycosyltransferase family 39 protein [Patescibacteria group bacterium]
MPFLKKLLPIFIIICLSYFTIRPLFISGFFPIHDDTQVQRVFEMKKSLADGMLPVRWAGDLGYGYGYPIFNFYAPSAYYIGGFLNLIGFDALIATKIMLGLAVVLSGITMYLLAKEFWGRIGGMISGVLYLFAPYHAVNIFVRGDFAELWAYTFIPLVFLGIYKISRRKKSWFWITVSALSFAAIIVSHNLTAMMITPFIIMYALILIISSSKNNR